MAERYAWRNEWFLQNFETQTWQIQKGVSEPEEKNWTDGRRIK